MKLVVRILLLSIVFQSFQCDDNQLSNSQITPQQLEEKKQEIVDYISSFSCTDASSCNYVALGAKPCGGPREYLAFPNTVNQTTLQNLVDEYYEMDNQHNIETGAISDCAVVSPPNNVDCVGGVCTILN